MYIGHHEQFLIISKHTGKIIEDKVYTSENRANRVLREMRCSDKDDFVIIPIDSSILLKIYKGEL